MEKPAAKMSDGRIDFLDYMRVFAFVSVLIGHKFFSEISTMAADQSTHVTLRAILDFIVAASYGGAAGVVVFFSHLDT